METSKVVTVTWKCETGRCGECRGQVQSMTGDRACEHPCHEEAS